ncbi:hypothetical protein DS909_22685 [Phaeobacter gallaeciensis]|uniref:Methyltransferase n=2 Tax=Roseobacteraceae TaxID=2854170 RepID=A0A366WLA3_9RHOB|nr:MULTISPECIES: hypothetical protein [Roseobacteraceae]MBT3139887.1 hypothetical protein [Falsiruegeria litorea]RBW49691.1 hypothetical protein DS909_22685 [Phaeobacter gallaeciensis]
MSTTPSKFVGDIPGHYDNDLGPNIFMDYANPLAYQCSSPVQNAIELAAGTGIVSQKLRDTLPPDAHLEDSELVRTELAAGGSGHVEHETIQLNKTIENLEAFATALVFGNPLIDEIRECGGVSA